MRLHEVAHDFPKIESPFVREAQDGKYLVTPEVNVHEDTGGSYDWVFEDDRVLAVEKIHGTCVSIRIVDGHVTGVWNRTNRIPAWSDNTGHQYIREGILHSMQRGYVDRLPDGQHFGELIGPSYHGNPYDLEDHVWIPFARARRKMHYKSWGTTPRRLTQFGRGSRRG